MKVTYIFVFVVLTLSSCKSSKPEVCCAFPDRYEKPTLEIPEESKNYIFDLGERSSVRQTIACQGARISAQTAIYQTLNERISLFVIDQDLRNPEDFTGEASMVMSRLTEIMQTTIDREMFVEHDKKNRLIP